MTPKLPADWPEENKTGPGFIQELMKCYPGKAVQSTPSNLGDAFAEFFGDEKAK